MGGKRKRAVYNHQRQRVLLPLEVGVAELPSPIESPPSNPRKHVTKSACLACQKRKTKCSGDRPNCTKCASQGISCRYDTDLSGETHTQAIKRRYNKLRAANTSYQDIYELLQSTSMANADEILKRIRAGADANTLLLQIEEAHPVVQPTKASHAPSHAPCFQHLQSWKLCRRNQSKSKSLNDLDQSTILTLPPRPLDTYSSSTHTDTWTHIGWTRAHIHHLIDALLTWDYLPISILCHDLFMQSFYNNSNRYCSSALVCATLALASRLVNEERDDLGFLPSGWVGSKAFFDEAKTALNKGLLQQTLPDIQAVGVLSLYYLRRGQEYEAQGCAEDCFRRITEFCKHTSSTDKNDEQYIRARDTTYFGALSLLRMLFLTTGKAFSINSSLPETDDTILDELSTMTEISDGSLVPRPTERANHSNKGLHGEDIGARMAAPSAGSDKSQFSSLQYLSSRIYQLTEWVYNFTMSAQKKPTETSPTIKPFYEKCLDWYGAIIAYSENDCGRTPFVLFTHIYYHFCLLCAFRPLINVALDDTDTVPHKICKEAAQSILALVQSYDDLFTLRRVSVLIPYFVCASGLFGVAMDTDGPGMNAVHLRLGRNQPGKRTRSTQQDSFVSGNEPPATKSYTTMSATDHARLLLDKIAAAHPVAKMARNQL